ncbi:hypothetical protein LINPERHAP2_LOCUS40990 [Linum perenne]
MVIDRSPRFVSISSDHYLVKTHFRYGSNGFPLTKPLPMSRRLILQQARGQIPGHLHYLGAYGLNCY